MTINFVAINYKIPVSRSRTEHNDIISPFNHKHLLVGAL